MKKRILIVDDEEGIRRYFSIVLAGEDREIYTAASGQAALDLLKERSVDLILLDLKMPGLDGMATLRAIRESGLNVPIYIVTGFETEFRDRFRQMKQEGILFELLHKPVQKAELAMAVASALEGPLADQSEKIRFFVAGRSPVYDKSVATFQTFLIERLSIRCEIEVVDVLENPIAAYNDNVFMTPTVIRTSGERMHRIIGDISDPARMAEMLGLF